MSLGEKLLLAFAILKICQGEPQCSLSKLGTNSNINCLSNGYPIPCSSTLLPNTVVHFQCSDYYELNASSVNQIECLGNGSWSHFQPKCVPKCGKISPVVPLIVHGKVIDAGAFPWQVALFHHYPEGWEFSCGGNLISSRMILTAAHCVWKIEPKDIKVGLGKRYNNMNETSETSQMIEVVEIEKLDSYQDSSGNYNGDLALLLLKEPAKMSSAVAPICIDWDHKYVDQQIVEGNAGVAVGWGLTENDTFSTELRTIMLPVQSNENCIKRQHRDFKKYVTYTSFCAGYDDGKGVCNGDSGGGLAFLDQASDTWYLQGIISLSPRRSGSTFCDPNHYSIFTKVAMFTSWLKKMEERENILENGEDQTINNQL